MVSDKLLSYGFPVILMYIFLHLYFIPKAYQITENKFS